FGRRPEKGDELYAPPGKQTCRRADRGLHAGQPRIFTLLARPPLAPGGHRLEQDHRFIKRVVKPAMGFFSFETAWRTLQGYETMHMMRKGQMQGAHKRDGARQAAFIAELFGVAIETQQKKGEAPVFVFTFGCL